MKLYVGNLAYSVNDVNEARPQENRGGGGRNRT